MSKTKFTKGDWETYTYEKAVNDEAELQAINVGGVEICADIENEHDAHLIKAAPKLYAEIEDDIEELHGELEHNCWTASHQERLLRDIKRKEKMLAEARGEE